jgi:hypothetical protein
MKIESKDIELAKEEINKVLEEFLGGPPSEFEFDDLVQRRLEAFSVELIKILDEPQKTDFLERLAELFSELAHRRMDILASELLKLIDDPEKMVAISQLAKRRGK